MVPVIVEIPRLMNRFIRCLAPLALILLAGSIARTADDKASTTYFPIQVGATWQYKVGENRFVLKIAKIEKVGKVDAARVEMMVAGKTTSFEHVGVTADAVLRYTFEGKTIDPPLPFLKLPPKAGQTWKVESKVDGQAMKGTLKAGTEEVKVPAGTYKAVTVSGQDMEVNGVKLNMTCYYAEKVGMVKQVLEMGKHKVVIELEKYEPGK
jgi:hypothetical protein